MVFVPELNQQTCPHSLISSTNSLKALARIPSLDSLKSDSKYLDVCFHKDLIGTHTLLKENEIAHIGKDYTKARQFMSYYDV